MSEQGEQIGDPVDQGDDAVCDAYVYDIVPTIDWAAKASLEREGNALFRAGKLDVAASKALRGKLLKACAEQEHEVAVSWLIVTSPDGTYAGNPLVK